MSDNLFFTAFGLAILLLGLVLLLYMLLKAYLRHRQIGRWHRHMASRSPQEIVIAQEYREQIALARARQDEETDIANKEYNAAMLRRAHESFRENLGDLHKRTWNEE